MNRGLEQRMALRVENVGAEFSKPSHLGANNADSLSTEPRRIPLPAKTVARQIGSLRALNDVRPRAGAGGNPSVQI